MRVPVRCGAVAAVLLCGVSAAATQERPAAAVFGSRVDLVSLDLVVRDRHGNLIRDLRPDEVEVYEDGVRQPVSEFRPLESSPSAAEVPIQTLPAGGRAGAPAAALGRVTVSRNERAALVGLVFDSLSAEGRALALSAARGLVASHLDPGAYVAVFRIDGRLKMAQNFTRDTAAVADALERATVGGAPAFNSSVKAMSGELGSSSNRGDPQQKGYDSRERRPAHFAGDPAAGTPMDGDGPATAERNIANAMLDILRTAEEAERTQRGHWSLDGLLSVVHGLRNLPGRKTLVYFCEGLQVPPGLEDPFRSLVSEANRAAVSIYSVDVRGLGTAGHLDDAREMLAQAVSISQSQRLSGGAWHGVTREQARQFETVEATLRIDAHGTLDDLSKATGGFLISDSNDLKRGIERLGEDTRAYYEIAYAPSDTRNDGRFHRVGVKVRRAGASVQSREGYYAVPHRLGEPVYAYEAPLLGALASRHRPRAFDHDSGVFRFAAEDAGVRHALAVTAPLEHVLFARDERGGRYLARVSLLALVRDASGDIVEKLGRDYVLEGKLAQLEAARRQRLTFVRGLLLAPGRYTVDTAVRDGLAERIGCSRSELVVPPPSAGLRLSSLVPLAGVAAAAPAAEEDDPLRAGELRMLPEPGRAMRATPGGEALALYYVVYTDPAAAEPPRVLMEVGRDGRVLERGGGALPAADASGRIAHVAKVPVHALAPGEYTLRVSVTQGAATASEQALLQVIAPGR